MYLLGFSQGAATASRWAVNSSLSFDGLVLWGGYPDHEITARVASKRLSGRRIVVAHGSDDHLVTPDELSKLKGFMASRRIEAEYWQYDGGHAVQPKQFQDMEQKIRGISPKIGDKS